MPDSYIPQIYNTNNQTTQYPSLSHDYLHSFLTDAFMFPIFLHFPPIKPNHTFTDKSGFWHKHSTLLITNVILMLICSGMFYWYEGARKVLWICRVSNLYPVSTIYKLTKPCFYWHNFQICTALFKINLSADEKLEGWKLKCCKCFLIKKQIQPFNINPLVWISFFKWLW